ncbi:hypothetical protein [Lutispora sp.]|uniref:hypothetical protein n=1 Tax=Lutispora sp. TaxID=2828727 RepID=UPI00356A3C99
MKAIRVTVVLLVIVMTFSLCACRKVEEKIAEKSAEKLLEKAMGVDVDITKDGGKVKVDGGVMEVGENLPWPKEAMGDLPKPEGKIKFVMEDEKAKNCTVTIAEFEPDDAAKYINKLKEMCIEGGNLSEDVGLTIFRGDTHKNASIYLHYSPDDKEGIIIYYPEGLGNSAYTPNTAADGDNY